jgi:hypothetical protein
MMDELELLKKDWQKKEEHLPRLSFDEIYKMIWKKSSSIVKWIFYISVLEFVLWATLNLVSYNQEHLQLEKEWHIYELSTVLNIVYYVVLVYFIYKFYQNYRQITVTDSSSNLMKSILKVKRTVTQYVWFNIAVFTISFLLMLYGSLRYGDESEKILNAAANAGNEIVFWVMFVVICLIIIGINLTLIWLFYKLI